MNTKRAEIDKRREYMKQLILKDPKMSGSKLNDEFHKKFNTRLRINTVYDLKEVLGYDRNGNRVGAPPEAARARNVAPVVAAGVFPLLVATTSDDKPLDFAERLLTRLQTAGVINLKVSGHGDSWLVIEQAT